MAAELAVDAMFGPIACGAAAALSKLVDRLNTPIAGPALAPKGERFLVPCGILYRRGLDEAAASVSPLAAGCARRCYASATTARSEDTAGGPRGVSGMAPRLLGGPGRLRR